MKSNPLVTVIIPTYNGADVISRSVNSALNQTYSNIEVIVVDDKSTDNTVKVVGQIKDNRVRVLVHEKNKNGSAARNTGMREAKGEYISFLDDDDEYLPNRIELLCKELLERGLEYRAITSDFYMQKGKDWKLVKRSEEDMTIANKLLMKSSVGGGHFMIHRSIIKDIGFWDESFRRHQDIEYSIRIIRVTKMAVLNTPTIRIYGHPGVPDAMTLLKVKENFFEKFKDEISKLPVKLSNQVYAKHWLQISRFFALDGDIKNTIKYLIQSLKYSIINSDIVKFLPKETYILLPLYLIRAFIFGKRKWSK